MSSASIEKGMKNHLVIKIKNTFFYLIKNHYIFSFYKECMKLSLSIITDDENEVSINQVNNDTSY